LFAVRVGQSGRLGQSAAAWVVTVNSLRRAAWPAMDPSLGISFASRRSLPPVFARRSRIKPDIERHDYPQNPLVEPSWTTTTTSSLALRGSYLGLSRFFFAAAVIYSRLPLFGLNTTKALRSRFLILHEFVAIDGRSCIVPSAFQDTRISLRHLATRN
jgi:hypothetical protein